MIKQKKIRYKIIENKNKTIQIMKKKNTIVMFKSRFFYLINMYFCEISI